MIVEALKRYIVKRESSAKEETLAAAWLDW